MRAARDYKPTHAAADRMAPELRRAIARGLERSRGRVSITALAAALAAKDVRGAMDLFPDATLAADLAPAGTIAREAVLRGGRLGAEALGWAAGRRK